MCLTARLYGKQSASPDWLTGLSAFVTKWGWGFVQYIDEANTGSGLKISKEA